jgi:deoxycytidine triphosphate deaminase
MGIEPAIRLNIQTDSHPLLAHSVIMFNIPEHALGFLTEHSTLGRYFPPHKVGITPLLNIYPRLISIGVDNN